MLYPQNNALRQCIDLSGFWDFRPDPDRAGSARGWMAGFSGGRPIAVPGSWNSQVDDVRNYLGDCWYQTRFSLPWVWQEKRVHLRFGSVNYLAEVWLNGVRLGEHEGGHLPFAFDVTPLLHAEDNLLVVRVDAALAPDRVPPGNVPPDPRDAFANTQHPATSFDFFPFAGIHRPVLLYATAPGAITDLTVVTAIDGARGIVHVRLERLPDQTARARLTLRGYGAEIVEEAVAVDESAETALTVPGAALWSSKSPALYDLTVELLHGAEAFDRYTLPVGIRTVAVEDDHLLLNGQPIYLRGFGRHEDFPVVGRGYLPALVIKDYELMRWVGANSFRTTHYPYSEQMMDLADRLGFLVIDETPAVGLFFRADGLERRMAVWKQQTRELIARDKNHPAVILWSLANEPHSSRPEARACFQEVFELARALDPTRPVTFVSHLGSADAAIDLSDVICLNRYRGWYTECGQLDEGVRVLSAELDALHEKYPGPMIITEFGADAVTGTHMQPPEMFSEEYQADMIMGYLDLFRQKPYIAGEHVWNLCDFKTAQAIHRVGAMNLKGIFTQDRRPKLAAHRLRERWKDGSS